VPATALKDNATIKYAGLALIPNQGAHPYYAMGASLVGWTDINNVIIQHHHQVDTQPP